MPNPPDIEPLDRPSGLLPTDPPVRGARWAAWLLLVLASAVLIFATVVRLPETVVATCTLVPVEGVDPLQAPIAGELAAILAREGQVVKAGAELFRLRSDEIRNARSQIDQLAEDTRAQSLRIRRLDESHTAELAIKDAEIAQAERELGFRTKHLATIQDIVRRSEGLAASGSVSPVDLLNRRLEEAESEKNLSIAEKNIQQLALERKEMETVRERQRADEKADAEKRRMQTATLEAQLADSSGDLKAVRAPYDAIVLRVLQRTPGGMVAMGAELCHLARVDSRLQARLLVPQAGIPRLIVGQRVRLFLDAFPYQRHGTLPAKITWLSPAPVNVDGVRHFIATAELEPEAGSVLAVLPGMDGEARVLVGRRTLAERALEPLRALREKVRAQ
jgi:multidrug efflux pump subunit AcrA (membrane-fusion protein)